MVSCQLPSPFNGSGNIAHQSRSDLTFPLLATSNDCHGASFPLFRPFSMLRVIKINCGCKSVQNCTTRMGFEPTRAEHIGLAVQRLNHSATSSSWRRSSAQCQSTTLLESSSTPTKCSHAGSRTRAFWVKARYPSR